MTDVGVSLPAALLRTAAEACVGGPLSTWVLVTVQGERARSESWLDDRRERLRVDLWSEGTPEEDILAIDEALASPFEVAGRVSRYVLASGGRILLSELLLGPLQGGEVTGHGFVPDLSPLIRHLGHRLPADHDLEFADTGVEAAVGALRSQRAEAVVLDADSLEGRTLVALGGAPWVALPARADAGPEPSGATVIAAAPATSALVRAALLTGTDVVFAGFGALPDGIPAAVVGR
ncbi:hypothetical protein AS850_06515 [Frondihabitans sp. 762G35]|uniref:hypothetical protein n=1 Tax=Frondihabitans sp. 762G35 TaxID=1446794 RepID=UPI000D200246|nr:hypothetical protein [Frondihabitans sp. 762G35]ARC56727.1 hypothetical protein AS850_06515 [Frondihabitans sp. 762G35]